MKNDRIEDDRIPDEMMVSEFAKVTGLSVRSVWNYVYRGVIYPRKDLRGRRWYSKEDALFLRALLETRKES